MGTAVHAVGTLVNKGGYNPEVRVRGGRAAHMWCAGKGTGQGRGGGRTRQTGAPLRVGKGHHVVRGVHFQTPFSLCSRACGLALCLYVCFRPATRPPNSHLCRPPCALCSVLVFLCVLCLVSVFVVALYLELLVTFMQSSEC